MCFIMDSSCLCLNLSPIAFFYLSRCVSSFLCFLRLRILRSLSYFLLCYFFFLLSPLSLFVSHFTRFFIFIYFSYPFTLLLLFFPFCHSSSFSISSIFLFFFLTFLSPLFPFFLSLLICSFSFLILISCYLFYNFIFMSPLSGF
jgi:hypothetical protein